MAPKMSGMANQAFCEEERLRTSCFKSTDIKVKRSPRDLKGT